jgi:hypothetical protein
MKTDKHTTTKRYDPIEKNKIKELIKIKDDEKNKIKELIKIKDDEIQELRDFITSITKQYTYASNAFGDAWKIVMDQYDDEYAKKLIEKNIYAKVEEIEKEENKIRSKLNILNSIENNEILNSIENNEIQNSIDTEIQIENNNVTNVNSIDIQSSIDPNELLSIENNDVTNIQSSITYNTNINSMINSWPSLHDYSVYYENDNYEDHELNLGSPNYNDFIENEYL